MPRNSLVVCATAREPPGPNRYFAKISNCPAIFSCLRNHTRGPDLQSDSNRNLFASEPDCWAAGDVARELLRKASCRFADLLERGDALRRIAHSSKTSPPYSSDVLLPRKKNPPFSGIISFRSGAQGSRILLILEAISCRPCRRGGNSATCAVRTCAGYG